MERETGKRMIQVQCGSEPVDMSTGFHENEGADHLTQPSITGAFVRWAEFIQMWRLGIDIPSKADHMSQRLKRGEIRCTGS